MAKISLIVEDIEGGGVTVKVEEVDMTEEHSKALIMVTHMWRYLNTCIEQGIFDEL